MPEFRVLINIKKSIVRKIVISYALLLLIVGSLSGILYYNITILANITRNIETLGEFLNDVLEMRRYEKNYLLYGTRDDLGLQRIYIQKTFSLLGTRDGIFREIFGNEKYAQSLEYLEKYDHLISEIYERPEKTADTDEIRYSGNQLTKIAEDAFEKERKKQAMYLSSLNLYLLLLISASLIFSILIGYMVAASVVKPIRKLEKELKEIAVGNFQKLDLSLNDREFISLTDAINRMIEELEKKKEHLVQTQKMESLGLMASGIAHELNNPLSNISSSSQILAEEIDDPSVDMDFKKKLLSQIKEQTERAKKIVNTVLDYSRSGKLILKQESLLSLVKETVSLAEIKKKSIINININIPESIVILADRHRFRQALLNLLSNSMDAMEAAGGVIEISGEVKEDRICLCVKDQGHGIDKDMLSKIFDPFFTTKDPGKGTGLGLHIAYEIIKDHGGELKALSRPGYGTSMFISLPVPETANGA